MDEPTAEIVMRRLRAAGSSLAITVEDLRGKLPDDEFKRHARAVGEALGIIQLDLMAPIIQAFPDLDPDRGKA
jgi:hypothetical protein